MFTQFVKLMFVHVSRFKYTNQAAPFLSSVLFAKRLYITKARDCILFNCFSFVFSSFFAFEFKGKKKFNNNNNIKNSN